MRNAHTTANGSRTGPGLTGVRHTEPAAERRCLGSVDAARARRLRQPSVHDTTAGWRSSGVARQVHPRAAERDRGGRDPVSRGDRGRACRVAGAVEASRLPCPARVGRRAPHLPGKPCTGHESLTGHEGAMLRLSRTVHPPSPKEAVLTVVAQQYGSHLALARPSSAAAGRSWPGCRRRT